MPAYEGAADDDAVAERIVRANDVDVRALRERSRSSNGRSLMEVVIIPYAGKRTGRLADASIEFKEGLLKGLRMIGFTINKNGKGELFVTFPSYNRNGKTPFYFLRPVEVGNADTLDSVESAILDAFDVFCTTAESAKAGGTPLLPSKLGPSQNA